MMTSSLRQSVVETLYYLELGGLTRMLIIANMNPDSTALPKANRFMINTFVRVMAAFKVLTCNFYDTQI